MSSLHVDLRNQLKVIDFIVDVMVFTTQKERAGAEKMIHQIQEGEFVSIEKLAETVRHIALISWPVRFAVRRFFATDGAKQEYAGVLAMVRPSTAHLLKRAYKASGAKTLDEFLTHSDSDLAIKDEERHEIASVRSQFREEYWKSHVKDFTVGVKEGERELGMMRDRLDTLRNLAVLSAQSMQDEIFSKIAQYEDRVLYGGETVPLTVLDEEVQYYTEQKVSSPFHE